MSNSDCERRQRLFDESCLKFWGSKLWHIKGNSLTYKHYFLMIGKGQEAGQYAEIFLNWDAFVQHPETWHISSHSVNGTLPRCCARLFNWFESISISLQTEDLNLRKVQWTLDVADRQNKKVSHIDKRPVKTRAFRVARRSGSVTHRKEEKPHVHVRTQKTDLVQEDALIKLAITDRVCK